MNKRYIDNSQENIIKLKQTVKAYHGSAGDVLALRGIDLQVQKGDFVAVLGNQEQANQL